MDINRLPFVENAMSKAEVYTNLQGLQSIKTEENRGEALKQVAKQFESLFVNMMTKSMRAANAVFEEDSPFNGEESKFYRDMLDQQRALSLSHGKGLGIAEAMYRQMARQYGIAPDSNEQSAAGLNMLDRRVQSPPSINLAAAKYASVAPSKDLTGSAISSGEKFAKSPEDFIEKIIPYAKKAADALGVDHLLLVAQSALETGWGKHILSDKNGESSFNLFNIKKGSDWQFDTVNQSVLEFEDGQIVKEQADFRSYQDISESFSDYANFIGTNERYAKATEVADNPQQYIQALQDAGYATDPQYSQKVLSVYERINNFVKELPEIMAPNER